MGNELCTPQKGGSGPLPCMPQVEGQAGFNDFCNPERKAMNGAAGSADTLKHKDGTSLLKTPRDARESLQPGVKKAISKSNAVPLSKAASAESQKSEKSQSSGAEELKGQGASAEDSALAPLARPHKGGSSQGVQPSAQSLNPEPSAPSIDKSEATGENLVKAAAAGDVAKVDKILKASPDLIDFFDNDGYTALHHASRYGETDTCRLLVENGATVAAKSFSNQTAADVAEDNGWIETVEFLSRPYMYLAMHNFKGENEYNDLFGYRRKEYNAKLDRSKSAMGRTASASSALAKVPTGIFGRLTSTGQQFAMASGGAAFNRLPSTGLFSKMATQQEFNPEHDPNEEHAVIDHDNSDKRRLKEVYCIKDFKVNHEQEKKEIDDRPLLSVKRGERLFALKMIHEAVDGVKGWTLVKTAARQRVFMGWVPNDNLSRDGENSLMPTRQQKKERKETELQEERDKMKKDIKVILRARMKGMSVDDLLDEESATETYVQPRADAKTGSKKPVRYAKALA